MTDFPKGWREVALGELFGLANGFAYKSSSWKPSGIPVIKIANVRNGKVSLDGCSYVAPSDSESEEKYGVKHGDMLMTLTGEIGAVGIYKEEIPARVNQRVARIDVKGSSITSIKALVLLLSAPHIKQALEKKSKGVAQPNLSPKDVLTLKTPLPPLAEQERIVEILEEQFSKLDKALEVANQLEARIASERRSLLHSAFTGELTSQWRKTHV